MATLRTQFGKLNKEKASGSGFKQPTARQKWVLQHLQLLKPFVLQRPSQSSLEVSRFTREREKMGGKKVARDKDV